MKSKRRVRFKIGDIIAIKLVSNRYGYGRILEEPLAAFYSISSNIILPWSEVIKFKIAFKVWIMRSAAKSENWEIIGNAPLDAQLKVKPIFFKEDPATKKLSTYADCIDTPATLEDCYGLEQAAVWDARNLESRLEGYFSNRVVASVHPITLGKPSVSCVHSSQKT